MSTTPPRSLCDLPNELLKSVSSLLYDPEAESRDEINFCWDNSELWARDLGHLSRTCSKLRAVGVEILFHVCPLALHVSIERSLPPLQTVPARIIRLPAWQHFILPNHRQHIKAVMLAGVTQAELRALLPYLAVLSSLEHLHLGPLVIKSLEGEDSATTSSSPYLLPTAQYVAGEDGTVTALRTALRRVKNLGVSCIEGGAALASVLSVANNVETLQLRGGTKYGHFREGIPSVDCPVFVPLLSLKHVRCLHLDEKNSALFTSAVSVFPDSAWWPLVELCMVTALTHFELDLVALLASTLEKLSLERAADFTDDPSSAPLLTCPFPRLRQPRSITSFAPFSPVPRTSLLTSPPSPSSQPPTIPPCQGSFPPPPFLTSSPARRSAACPSRCRTSHSTRHPPRTSSISAKPTA